MNPKQTVSLSSLWVESRCPRPSNLAAKPQRIDCLTYSVCVCVTAHAVPLPMLFGWLGDANIAHKHRVCVCVCVCACVRACQVGMLCLKQVWSGGIRHRFAIGIASRKTHRAFCKSCVASAFSGPLSGDWADETFQFQCKQHMKPCNEYNVAWVLYIYICVCVYIHIYIYTYYFILLLHMYAYIQYTSM